MNTVIRNMFVVAAALVHSAIAAEEAHTPTDHISWNNKIDDARSWRPAQRTVGQYRQMLDEFLMGPRHQMNSGYSMTLRSYDVEAVDENRLSGTIYVDIVVNQSWWDTYYKLVGVLSPQGSAVVYEGPIKVVGDTPRADMDIGARVDQGLRYALAHPLPVRLSFGSHVSNFILYKNALLVSAQPMTEDSARNEHQRLMARRGEISLTKGNVTAGNADIDRQRSTLNCGVVEQGDSAVYCGTRFTVRIPYEVANESELVEAMNRGVRKDLSLYGDACENDCDLFHQEAEDLDSFDLLEEAIIRSH